MAANYTTSNEQKVKDHSLNADVNEHLAGILGDKFREYRRRWKRASRMEEVTAFPLFLVFEPMWRCNLHCIMCLHSNDSNPAFEYSQRMPWEMYAGIMDEVKAHYCPSITIGGHCEPMLDTRLYDMVSLARDSGVIDTMINTNATLLTRENGRKLIEAGLTRLRIGFDGATPETYESIRVGAKYSEVMGNILGFLELRREMDARLPVVRISCVHLSTNDAEVDAFVEFWKKKVDYVSIQPHELTKERERSHFGAGEEVIRNVKCSEPWERLYIRGNGGVYPCCQPAIGPLVGNVNNSSIHDIWNSAEMRNIRDGIARGDWSKIPSCGKCLMENYNPG